MCWPEGYAISWSATIALAFNLSSRLTVSSRARRFSPTRPVVAGTCCCRVFNVAPAKRSLCGRSQRNKQQKRSQLHVKILQEKRGRTAHPKAFRTKYRVGKCSMESLKAFSPPRTHQMRNNPASFNRSVGKLWPRRFILLCERCYLIVQCRAKTANGA
jgi:hypothetical protein